MPRVDLESFGRWTRSDSSTDESAGAVGPKVNRCADCNSAAPRTQTNYTLISSQHGWRLTFEKKEGRRISVWRCPKCWKEHKRKTKTGIATAS